MHRNWDDEQFKEIKPTLGCVINIIQPFIEKTPMLLRCCLIHITIIILRYILHLVCLCLCLSRGLFMLYLCDLFFLFSLIFFAINYVTSFKQTYLFLVHFFEYLLLFLGNNTMKKANNFQIARVQHQGVVEILLEFFADFNLAWL